MRALLVLIPLFVFAAAQTSPKKLPPITEKAAERALELAKTVKPGLTLKELWVKVGLSKFAEPAMGRGSGSTRRYHVNYELTRFHRLGLVVDYTQKPPRVLEITPVKFKHPS